MAHAHTGQLDNEVDFQAEREEEEISSGVERGSGGPAVRVDVSGAGEGGGLTSTDASWSPPACYYAPKYTPAQYKTYWEDLSERFLSVGNPREDKTSLGDNLGDRYGEDGEFPDYNAEKEGEGMFWQVVRNENHPDRQAQLACEWQTFWVDFDEPLPDLPHIIDIKTLADLAYESTTVPETRIDINPDGSQKVNLPTWIWGDDVLQEPVTVTASLDDYGLWATTTATPAALTIQPGHDNALTHPSDGICPPNSDGSFGEPYSTGRADELPPCGVTYQQATHQTGTHPLTASLTWDITWEGSDGSNGTLPPGTFETTYDITVEEIQTIVR